MKTMYGTLDAAQQWGEHYARALVAAGFSRGRASPCHFFHSKLQVRVLVHGDDFLIVGRRAGREFTLNLLRQHYELSQVEMLGTGTGEVKELRFLGRILSVQDWGIQYEPDPTHHEQVIAELNLSQARGVASPGAPDEAHGLGSTM